MNRLFQRTTVRVVPFVVLLVLPLLVGGVVAYAGLPGALALLGIAVAALVLHLLRGSAVHIAALAVCAAIILYPAFLPRSTSEIGAFTRATTSSRAQIQLLIIIGLMMVAGWLWLSTPGSIAALTRAPFNLFACYSGMILLSLTYTPDKAWSFFAILKLFEAFLVVAVLAVLVKSLGQLRRVVNVMLGAIGVVLVIFWLDVVSGNATVQNFTGRFTTSWLHANTTTLMASTFTSMMVARFFTASTKRVVCNAAILTCFGAITGLLAGGKTALIGGIVAVALSVAVMISKRGGSSKIGRLLLMGCGLALVTGYVVVMNIGVAAHLQTYNENAYLDASNLTGRVPLWAVVFRQAMETPLFGHGYMSSFAVSFNNGLGWRAYQAHNSFLQTFFDLGLVGLVVVVLIYGGTWYTVLRQAIGRSAADEHWSLSVELLAALAVLTINSLVEDVFGGIFEIRTMLFILVVFAIYQNRYVHTSKTNTVSS